MAGPNVVGFAFTAAVLIAVPGPSVLFVLGRALTIGRRGAIASVIGNAIGVYAVAVLVAFGLGSVVQRSDTAFLVVKAGGAAYLVYLGVQAIRRRGDLSLTAGRAVETTTTWQAIRQGFVVGLANPKAFIIFGAVLPQFVDRGAGHVPAQMLLLALLAFGIALVSDTIWACLASGLRTWLIRDSRRIAAVGGIGGLSMIGVGVNVAVTGRHD